jgi:hypothetical protein
MTSCMYITAVLGHMLEQKAEDRRIEYLQVVPEGCR